MFRQSTRAWAILLVAASYAFCGGCATAPTSGDDAGRPVAQETDVIDLKRQFDDQTPSYIQAGALDSVVLIHDEQTRALGSGTVIAPDRVLTAAHVIAGLTRDPRGRLLIQIDGQPVIAVVEAAGDPDTAHGDWALLVVEPPPWTRVAPVHMPALEDGWAPSIDTEVLLVGYAAGFFEGLQIDVDAPTPCVSVRIRETGAAQSSWYAVGDPLDLSGMSGGAAMIWNHESQRAELIGVFRGYVATETVTIARTRILGVVTSVRETKQPGVAYMIHRLPSVVTNPRSVGQ